MAVGKKGKIVKVKPKFKISEIKNIIASNFKNIQDAILSRLQTVGEDFVTNARNKGSYTDRTGNLRSSVGYVVLKNGEQYHRGGFQVIKGTVQVKIKKKKVTQTGVVGREVGRIVLDEVISKFPTGLVLIVVAGMEYAAAVESKGKDVLTGSSQIAVKRLKEAMKKIRKSARKAA